MDRIYRLRLQAVDLAERRGHVFSYFRREFKLNEKGEIVKGLRSECAKCGAPLVVVDKNKEGEFISGSASEFNCKVGAVKTELPVTGMFTKDRIQYEERKKRIASRIQKKFAI